MFSLPDTATGEPNPLKEKVGWLESSMLMATLAAYAVFLWLYFVPIYNGVDPNGYQVAAKIFSDEGTFGQKPFDDYSFVGRMWVINSKGEAFAKYPPLYPALGAYAIRLFGAEANLYVNIICSFLAVLGIYVLSRIMGLGRWSLLAALLLATNPVFNNYSVNQVSHPSSMAFLIWGYAAFFIGWKLGGRSYTLVFLLISGFLIGYSAGIRYTDFMMAFPPIFLLWDRFRGKGCLPSISYFAGLAIPWGLLGLYHWASFGHPWTTGYALTGEQTGFSLSYFYENIRFYIVGIFNSGLGPMAILSILGFMLLWKRSLQSAIFYSAWIIPTLLLYTAYYWAPETRHVGFLRFLLPIFIPAILLAAMFLRELDFHGYLKGFLRASAIAGLVVIQSAWGILGSIENVESLWQGNVRQKICIDFLRGNIPAGSVVISTNDILNYLDFTRDYILYTEELFNQGRLKALTARADIDEPAGLQKERALFLKKEFVDIDYNSYMRKIDALIKKHFDAGRQIYFAVPGKLRNVIISSGLRYYDFEEKSSLTKELPLYRLLPNNKFNTLKEKKIKNPVCDITIVRLVGKRDKPLVSQEELEVLRKKIQELSNEIYGDKPELRDNVDRLFQMQNRMQQLQQDIRRQEENAKKKRPDAKDR